MEGILEHVIFLLDELKIQWEQKFLTPKDGFPRPRFVLTFDGMFLHIIKHPQRVVYKFGREGDDLKQISKNDILNKIKEL